MWNFRMVKQVFQGLTEKTDSRAVHNEGITLNFNIVPFYLILALNNLMAKSQEVCLTLFLYINWNLGCEHL
jgi:hypothetical protein